MASNVSSMLFGKMALPLIVIGCSSSPNRSHNSPPKLLNEFEKTQTYSAETFYKNIDFRGASFSKDESKLLVTSNKSGIFNAYSMPFSGGHMDPLTFSTDKPQYGVSYFPNDDRFIVTHDDNGNELNHLYVVEPNGKKTDITPGNNLKAVFWGWNEKKTHFIVSSNERDIKFFDLYLYSSQNLTREMIYKNEQGFAGLGSIGSGHDSQISPDTRWLTLLKVNNNADTDIYIQDITNKASRPVLISNQKGDVNDIPATFFADSSKLVYLTDAHGEFEQAWTYDLISKQHELFYKADWNVSWVQFSQSGRYRMIWLNEDAQKSVRVFDQKLQTQVPISSQGENVVAVHISPSESKMAYYLESDTSPRNLYTMPLDTRLNTQGKRLTTSLNSSIKESNLVASRVVRYKSYDGLPIPSILYRPHQASKSNKVPAIVYVHGGPGGQNRKGFLPKIQHLVNHGYTVLLVNNRGSSGYGKTFYHLDDKKHGDVDLKDCIWAKKYLETLPWVNPEKIAIMGRSYGGYMVAAALTFAPEVFDLGIDIFGVTNWPRTLKEFPIYWASMNDYLVSEIGDPVLDAKMLKEKSPLFYADNIQKPLLVVQGKNDPRVLKAESDELVAAVKKNGIPVKYLLFEDEGHGFRKTKNRIKASEGYLKFLQKHL